MKPLANAYNSKPSGPGQRSVRSPWFAAPSLPFRFACVLVLSCRLWTVLAAAQDGPTRLPDYLDPETVNAAGPLPLEYFDVWTEFRPRFSFVYDAGRGIGYRDSFTSLEAFVPFAHPSPDRLWFADFRGLFNKEGATGGNIGLGRRQFCPRLNATLGAYLYYDSRSTAANQFQQISPGFELLTDRWDFRLHGYLPEIFGDRKVAPDGFRGNLLYIDRFETALTGADLEMGMPLWQWGRVRPKLVGGGYYFSGPTRGSFWGWKARIEGDLTDAISLRLSVQDDPVFDTTVNLAVAVRFGSGDLLQRRPLHNLHRSLFAYPHRRRPRQRLADPIYRLQNVAIDLEETLALDPDTTDPIDFLHVAPLGPGPGTFEDPYAKLTEALDDPTYMAGDVDVIYVQSDFRQTVTHRGDFRLVDGTQLLSNGPVQTIATQLGDRILPLSGNDPDLRGLPIIAGQVALGNDTTLSGFLVRSGTGGVADDVSVLVDAVRDFNINNNVLFSKGQDAIHILLRDIPGGSGLIENNTVIGNETQLAGVAVRDSMLDLGILNNDLSNHAEYGIVMVDSAVRGDIAGNRIDNNNIAGISIQASDSLDPATFEGDIKDNTLSQNELRGIEFLDTNFAGGVIANTIDGVFTLGDPSPDLTVSRIFTVDAPRPDISDDIPTDDSGAAKPTLGIRFEGGSVEGDIADNSVNNNGFGGIFIRGADVTGNISGNTTSDNGADGIALQDSTLTGNIRDNTVNDNDFGGILINDTPMTGTISGNETRGNQEQGILFAGADFTGDILNNTSTGNGRNGFVVNAPSFTGNIEGNTSRDNGGDPNSPESQDGFQLYVNNFTGDIRNNTINENESRGMTITPFDFNALNGTFDGNIVGNTFEENRADGLFIIDMNFNGNITDNTFLRNNFGDANLFIIGEVDFVGDISRNTSRNNRAGIVARVDNFLGDISFNTITRAAVFGIWVETAETFVGDIRGNTILEIADPSNSFAGDGITVTAQGGKIPSFSGDIAGNRVNNAFRHGISAAVEDFTGDVINNQVTSSGKKGMLLEFDDLDGNILRNTANDNGEEGIQVDVSNAITGNVNRNTANDNDGAGIAVNSDTLTGNVAANTANENNSFGIAVNSNTITGNVSGNSAVDNNGNGITVAGATTGNVTGNTASQNSLNGIEVLGILNGDISDNTTNSNTVGIAASGQRITGNILNNVSMQNDGDGIALGLGQFMGTIGSNNSSLNGLSGIYAEVDQFNGGITGNTVSDNGDVGIYGLGEFVGSVSGNTVMNNDLEGIQLEIVDLFAPVDVLQVLNNSLQGNNGSGRELLIDNTGSAALDLTLNGNTSTNVVPPGQFNFDLLNTGTGTFNVSPVGVNGVNTGTVGSSDGSVTIP